MEVTNQLIIVNGSDKTKSIASFHFAGGKCDIIYTNSPHAYSYNSSNVKVLKLQKSIDPTGVIIKVKGNAIINVERILDFGPFFYIVCNGGAGQTFERKAIELSKNCLADKKNNDLFEYFKATAEAVSLKTGNDINILSLQYAKIHAVSQETTLAKYLNQEQPVVRQSMPETLIYPFGLNQSQKKAVENAFSSQVSIIQGPPGTGKTQTILNIIANAVLNGKTVAVVSNNNSATKNVAEKLEKKDLSFLTAFLGSLENKAAFLDRQTGKYPDMSGWKVEWADQQKLGESITELSAELNSMLDAKNRIAKIEQELLDLKPEQFYFQKYYTGRKITVDLQPLGKLSSQKIISLWIEYENYAERGNRLAFLQKLLLWFRFSKASLVLFRKDSEDVIPLLQNLYYQKRISELQEEKAELEAKLKGYRFEEKMRTLSEQSMKLFKAKLAGRYHWSKDRRVFEQKEFRGCSDEFNKEYPVILSTTYSIKGTLSTEHIYDYLIVDEASQVDLATGVLAFSCAKNIVIVGDQKQLPNVLTPADVQIADSIWYRHNFDERYHFATHSMLASAAEIWDQAPSVLLREHYRCHPKIAGFFNQKFYYGELIVMTEDHGEKDVLTMYRTTEGNHARGHMNQRQIDVIREEVLPALEKRGFHDIGIITPYRDQVAAISRELGEQYETATVHKFQGREKDAIVLASVDNEIGEFVDNPNLLNVAVSRAVKSLSVVISNNKANEKTNYGDLAKYIEYHNFQIVDSKVFSVFDMLYKGFNIQRMEYLKKSKRVSEYDSENLAFSVISGILRKPEFSQIACAAHTSLATLVNDYSLLTEAETRYVSNPLTHIDFLLFHRMDKRPVLAIEIDGTRFHAEGSRQAERDAMKNRIFTKCGIPYLRIRTNESGENERIRLALEYALAK